MIKLIALIFTGSVLGFFILNWNSRDSSSWPYKLPKITKKSPSSEILLIGSYHEPRTVRFLKKHLFDKLPASQKFEIKLIKGLGLHRVLHYIYSLEKPPKLIYYFGNLEEAYEIRMNLGSNKKVQLKELTFGTSPKDPLKYSANLLKLYQKELEALVWLTQKNQSKLVFITTPIDQSQKIVDCAPVPSKYQRRMDLLSENLSQGDFKNAYELSKGLLFQKISSPTLMQLHSLVLKNLDKTLESQKYLINAQNENCDFYAQRPVYNQILRNYSKNYKIPLIDLASKVREKTITDKKERNQMIKKESLSFLAKAMQYFLQ
jgi:hypothetical protein